MQAAGKRWITYPSRSDQITLWHVADIHWGHAACAKDRVKEDLETIRTDPNAFWIGGGDFADYISPHDKRWHAGSIDSDVIGMKDLGRLGQKMYEDIKALFDPIKDKCLGLAFGNHEQKYAIAKEQEALHGWLCTALGVESLEYSALLDLCFYRGGKRPVLLPAPPDMRINGWEVRLAIHHGYGSAATPGGKLNTLIKFMHNVEADVYLMGHVHDQKGQRNVRIGADAPCKRLVAKESVGVITGSYLKTYAQGVTSYGEVKGYSPTPLGAAKVMFQPNKRRIIGEV